MFAFVVTIPAQLKNFCLYALNCQRTGKHTRVYTYVHTYVYMHMCVWVRVGVCKCLHILWTHILMTAALNNVDVTFEIFDFFHSIAV